MIKTPKDRNGNTKAVCASCGRGIIEPECEMIKTKRHTTMFFHEECAAQILSGKESWWDTKIGEVKG